MDINKLKAHLGQAREYKIGGDTFYFKPLTLPYLPDLLGVVSKFSADAENPLSLLNKEDINNLINLVRVMINNSYPNWRQQFKAELMESGLSEEEATKQAEQTIDDFIYNNFFTLVTALFEINNLGASVDENKKAAVLKRLMPEKHEQPKKQDEQ